MVQLIACQSLSTSSPGLLTVYTYIPWCTVVRGRLCAAPPVAGLGGWFGGRGLVVDILVRVVVGGREVGLGLVTLREAMLLLLLWQPGDVANMHGG